MRSALPLVAPVAVLALLGTARADVLRLKNGRLLEGKVVRRTEGDVHVRLAAGTLVVPLATIASIDSRLTAEEELADALGGVDLEDARAIEALAVWASRRGLGEQATDLLDLSRGIRLERVVAAARAAGTPVAYVDAFHWARAGAFDEVTLGWLVRQAEALDPEDPAVRGARATLARDQAAAADAAARAEARRGRPSYLDPARTRIAGADALDVRVGARRGATWAPAAGPRPGDPDPGARGRALVERLTRLRSGSAAPGPGVKRTPPGRAR